MFNILWSFNKKYKYIYGIYAYIFCKIDQCWNVFTNLIHKGTLCDINYIFGDQGNLYFTISQNFIRTRFFTRWLLDGKIRISFSDLSFSPLLWTRRLIAWRISVQYLKRHRYISYSKRNCWSAFWEDFIQCCSIRQETII